MSQLAREMMDHYGLKSWKFKFDGGKTRFGQCDYRTKTISMSKHLVPVNDPKACLDTLLHEIAHALTPGAMHGKKWKAKARELGCTPKATYHPDVVTEAPHTWLGRCPQCMVDRVKVYKRTQMRRLCHSCNRSSKKPVVLQWVRNPLAA